MFRISHATAMVVVIAATGCSGTREPQTAPEVSETLQRHWASLRLGDWKAAYVQLHPDVTASGLTLDRFARLQAPRAKAGLFVGDLMIGGSEPSGEDVIVTFDVVTQPANKAAPRRRATLRKSGDTWKIATHDLLAARN